MEIEKKILEIDKKAFTARLNQLKAKKIFEGLLRVKYFDSSDCKIKKKKDLLRLREFSPKNKKNYCELVYKTYKGVKNGCKYFHETEFILTDKNAFDETSEFMLKLGLKQTLYYEKKRTLFKYKNAKIEIDEHPCIPVFVEIEASSPAVIEKTIKILKLEKYEQSAENINELMKRKYPQIRLNGLTFKCM